MINEAAPNLSASAFRINAIRELLRERESSLVKINIDANRRPFQETRRRRCGR
jgi:hypothetical protein